MRFAGLLLALAFPAVLVQTARSGDASAPLARVLEASRVRAGLCVHLGVSDGKLTAALGRHAPYLVHGLAFDAARLDEARNHLRKHRLYGRVSVEAGTPEKLPYANDTVNLLVVEGAGELLAEKLKLEEVLRVLAPHGAACLEGWRPAGGKGAGVRAEVDGWTILTKPYPAGGDEWKHFNYDPSANRVSRDVLVEPFWRLRWIAGVEWPMPDYKAKSMVVGGGRVYYVINESPYRKTSWPALSVRDAFSGVLLWKSAQGPKPLTMIAAGPRFYMESGGKLVAVDGATGALLKTYDEASQPDWAYLHEDQLLVSCGNAGVLKNLDPETGAVRWSLPQRSISSHNGLNNAAIVGREILYVETERRSIGCVDLASGTEHWNRPVGDELNADGKVTLTAQQDGVMVLSSETGIHAFSARDGKHLWNHTYERIGTPFRRKAKSYRDGFFIDGLYWVHVGDVDLDPNLSAKERYRRPRTYSWQGLEPRTGKVARVVPYPEGKEAGASCFKDQATVRYFMGAYTDFVDVKTGEYQPKARALKTSCGIGPRVAYGLMYNTTLYMPGRFLQGDMALEGAAEDPARPAGEPSRLSQGRAFEKVSGPNPGPEDWPCYRYDTMRTSRTPTQVPVPFVELWSTETGAQPGAPTVAAGTVFVSSIGEHAVAAFDANDGNEKWRFTAGGRVRVPPAYSNGLCLFGAADGQLYALSVATGELAWRFEAARTPRRIVARERIESAWPLDEGVLVHDGVVYGVAGRHGEMDGGFDWYALECASGKLVWHRQTQGSSSRLLACDGTALTNGETRFGIKSPEGKAGKPALPSVAHERDVLSPSYILGKPAALPLRLRAMVCAGETVFAAGRTLANDGEAPRLLLESSSAGETHKVPEVHPLNAEAAKEGAWMLYAFSAGDGRKLAEWKLTAEPVWDGLAAANGRLYLCTEDGKLHCFGK